MLRQGIPGHISQIEGLHSNDVPSQLVATSIHCELQAAACSSRRYAGILSSESTLTWALIWFELEGLIARPGKWLNPGLFRSYEFPQTDQVEWCTTFLLLPLQLVIVQVDTRICPLTVQSIKNNRVFRAALLGIVTMVWVDTL